MPTLLPPQSPEHKQRDEFSPVLVLAIGVLALLLVIAEAQAMIGSGWITTLPPDANVFLPI
jgi:hypothetical protein